MVSVREGVLQKVRLESLLQKEKVSPLDPKKVSLKRNFMERREDLRTNRKVKELPQYQGQNILKINLVPGQESIQDPPALKRLPRDLRLVLLDGFIVLR